MHLLAPQREVSEPIYASIKGASRNVALRVPSGAGRGRSNWVGGSCAGDQPPPADRLRLIL